MCFRVSCASVDCEHTRMCTSMCFFKVFSVHQHLLCQIFLCRRRLWVHKDVYTSICFVRVSKLSPLIAGVQGVSLNQAHWTCSALFQPSSCMQTMHALHPSCQKGSCSNWQEEEKQEDELVCPQGRLMTVHQTSPGTLSEGDVIDEETNIDINSNRIIRPTLQVVLCLAELIATTGLKDDRVKKQSPHADSAVAVRAIHDISAQAQTVIDQDQADLINVTVVLAGILILTMTLAVLMGTQYHMGLVLVQFLDES